MIATILLLVAAAYLLWTGSIMKTENFRSAFIFKTLPIGMSFGLVLVALKLI